MTAGSCDFDHTREHLRFPSSAHFNKIHDEMQVGFVRRLQTSGYLAGPVGRD
jgi:hypothetical protein